MQYLLWGGVRPGLFVCCIWFSCHLRYRSLCAGAQSPIFMSTETLRQKPDSLARSRVGERACCVVVVHARNRLEWRHDQRQRAADSPREALFCKVVFSGHVRELAYVPCIVPKSACWLSFYMSAFFYCDRFGA